jgi:hypothetical protein
MRSVQTEASTHDQSRASVPRLALAGTADTVACFIPSVPHPPSCPPSLGTVLLSALSAAHHRCSTIRALTPAAPRQRDRPLCLPRFAFGASRPQPRRAPERHVPVTSCVRSGLSGPGFALTPASSPLSRRRIGFVILRAALPPPAAPHLASRRRSCLRLHVMVTSHDTDFHRAHNAYSQTHRRPALAGRLEGCSPDGATRGHGSRRGLLTMRLKESISLCGDTGACSHRAESASTSWPGIARQRGPAFGRPDDKLRRA